MSGEALTVGVVSDTHGLLRPEVTKAFEGVDLILHAGDMGKEDIVPRLKAEAPVKAVRGNVDRGTWALAYPLTEALELGGLSLYMFHGHLEQDLDLDVFDVVISGHSHVPVNEKRGQTLYLNPGSAGPKRFHLPVSYAILTIRDGAAQATLIEISP